MATILDSAARECMKGKNKSICLLLTVFASPWRGGFYTHIRIVLESNHTAAYILYQAIQLEFLGMTFGHAQVKEDLKELV